jgi:hypothetical protein
MTRKIIGPRSLYDPATSLEKDNVKKQRLMTGTKENSIVIDATKQGLVFNAFYSSNEGTKYSILRQPVRISWDELEKIKVEMSTTVSKRNKTIIPSFNDKPSKEYLSNLPIVTINDRQYYIDGELRQRRPVNKPEQVFNYGDKA